MLLQTAKSVSEKDRFSLMKILANQIITNKDNSVEIADTLEYLMKNFDVEASKFENDDVLFNMSQKLLDLFDYNNVSYKHFRFVLDNRIFGHCFLLFDLPETQGDKGNACFYLIKNVDKPYYQYGLSVKFQTPFNVSLKKFEKLPLSKLHKDFLTIGYCLDLNKSTPKQRLSNYIQHDESTENARFIDLKPEADKRIASKIAAKLQTKFIDVKIEKFNGLYTIVGSK